MNPRLGTMIAISSVLVAVGSDAYALSGTNASSTTKLMVNTTDTETVETETVETEVYAFNDSSTTKLDTRTSNVSVGSTFSTDGLSLSGVVLQTSIDDVSAGILTDEAKR